MRISVFILLHLLFGVYQAESSFYSVGASTATNLPELPWTACAAADGGCGFLEFCVYQDTKFAYRLPGEPCHPGRGPTLRMHPGKTYQLTVNNTGNPSIERHGCGFHTHGLHISPSGNADNITRVVKPGQCTTYTFAIPADHMGGTHWYYSSFHLNVEVQMHGGAFGMIIIPESDSFAPTPEVQTWLQNELVLVASKMEEQLQLTTYKNLYLGNGYEHAFLSMVANSWYRLRVVGMEVGGRPGTLDFPSACSVHSVAVDGVWGLQVPINTVSQSSYEMIHRLDFAIKCSPGRHNVTFFGGKVAELTVVQDDAAVSPGTPFVANAQWTTLEASRRPGYLQDLRSYSGTIKKFTWYMTDGYVNNVSWNASTPLLNLTYGDVVEWTLKSTGSAPFHLQTYPMQVVTAGGCGWHKEGEYYDVISAINGVEGVGAALDLAEPPAGNDCVVRFQVLDYGGRVIVRSEYQELSDWGTMAWVNVSGGPPIDTTNMENAQCRTSGRCVLDGTCTPVHQCNSTVGRDNCGGPCECASPVCPSTETCETIKNVCVSNKRRQRVMEIRNTVAQLAAARGLAARNTVLQKQVTSPTTLLTLPWTTEGCPVGYDFCGVLEFCDLGDGIRFAYRLPGQPCRPAKCPVIRMQPGKKYRLALQNMATPGPYGTANIHTHGIHVPGAGNSDDITREVKPGYILYYTYAIPADHLGGTMWYHAHVHHLTWRHVAGGAFGMLIIEDPITFAPTAQFQQFLDTDLLLVASKVGDVFLGNGNANEPLALRTKQWHRLRIVGVDPEVKPKDLIIGDSNCDVHRMQHDGVWNTVVPANVIPKNVWTMSGANRVEVAIRCSTAGIYPVRWFGGVVALLVVQNGLTTTASPWVGPGQQWSTESKRPPYLQDLRSYDGPLVPHTFTIRHGYVNDRPWNKEVPLAIFKHKDVVEWTFRGTAGHSFHLHIWHMQVVTPGGCGFHEEGQWYDVISRSDGGDCTVRVPLTDYYDRTVLHCHYLEHEDAGTMAWVNVTNPTGKYIPLDYAFINPVPIPKYVAPTPAPTTSTTTNAPTAPTAPKSDDDMHHGHHTEESAACSNSQSAVVLSIVLGVSIPVTVLLLAAGIGYWAYRRHVFMRGMLQFEMHDVPEDVEANKAVPSVFHSSAGSYSNLANILGEDGTPVANRTPVAPIVSPREL